LDRTGLKFESIRVFIQFYQVWISVDCRGDAGYLFILGSDKMSSFLRIKLDI